MRDRHGRPWWRLPAAAALLAAALASVGTLTAAPAGAAGAPEAELSIIPASGPLTVTFVARAARFPSPVVSYEWVFGDGATATTKTGKVTHQYGAAAVFKPSVTEIDAGGGKAAASGTVRLTECPAGSPRCSESLSGAGTVRLLTVSGAVGVAAAGAVNLFAGPYRIAHCQLEVVPTVAFTDSAFTGDLTVTLEYTTTLPSQVRTTCFSSTVPFIDAGGQKVTSGPLPACQAVNNAAPCVESTQISGSSVKKSLFVPPGDPKVGAP